MSKEIRVASILKSNVKIGIIVWTLSLVGALVVTAVGSEISARLSTATLKISASASSNTTLLPGSKDNVLLTVKLKAINASKIKFQRIAFSIQGDPNQEATFINDLQNVYLTDELGKTMNYSISMYSDYLDVRNDIYFLLNSPKEINNKTQTTIYLKADVSADAYKNVIKSIKVLNNTYGDDYEYNDITAFDNSNNEVLASVTQSSEANILINGQENQPIILLTSVKNKKGNVSDSFNDGDVATIFWESLNVDSKYKTRLVLVSYDADNKEIGSHQLMDGLNYDGSVRLTLRTVLDAYSYKIKAELYKDDNDDAIAYSESSVLYIDYAVNKLIPKIYIDTENFQKSDFIQGEKYQIKWSYENLIVGYNNLNLIIRPLNNSSSADVLDVNLSAISGSYNIDTKNLTEGCYVVILKYKLNYGILASEEESPAFCVKSNNDSSSIVSDDLVLTSRTLRQDKYGNLLDFGNGKYSGYVSLLAPNKDITIKNITIKGWLEPGKHNFYVKFLAKDSSIYDLDAPTKKGSDGKWHSKKIWRTSKKINNDPSLKTITLSNVNIKIKKGGYRNLFFGFEFGAGYNTFTKKSKERVDKSFQIVNIDAIDKDGNQVVITSLPFQSKVGITTFSKLDTIKSKKKKK